MAVYPCTDDPNEILDAIFEAEDNADKLDKFVNGGVLEEVQLGTGQPTPTIRNLVHLVKSAAAVLDGSDVSGKFSDAANGGTTLRMLSDRFGDHVCVEDYGAIGDGIADDTEAFEDLESFCTDRRVNLHGKTFKVHTPFCKNYYYNGFWTYDVDYAGEASPATKPAYNDNVVMEYGSVHASGSGTTGRNYCILNDCDTEDLWKTNLKNVVAIGEDTLTKSIKEHSTYLSDYIAIGRGVMSEADMTANPGHNIGIGQHALHRLTTGDRNIAIGSLAMQFTTTGYKNIAIGRDAAQTMIGGAQNLVIGYQALSGCGWSAGSTYLEAQNSVSPVHCTFIGSHSGPRVSGVPRRCTLVGAFSLTEAKSVSNSTVIGSHVAEFVGYDKSLNQRGYINYSAEYYDVDVSASYSGSGTEVTLTPEDSAFLQNASVGMQLYVSMPGLDSGKYDITNITSTTVTIDVGTRDIHGRSGSGAEIETLHETPKLATFSASSSRAILTPADSSVVSDAVVGRYIYANIPGIGENILIVESKTATTITVILTGNAIDGTSGTATIYGVETNTNIGYSDKTVNRCAMLGELQFNRATDLFAVTAIGSQVSGSASGRGGFARTELIGYQCGYKLASSSRGVAIGSQAASSAVSIEDSVALGSQACVGADSIVNSICIGFQAGCQSGVDYNNVLIGDAAGSVLVGRDVDDDDVTNGPRRNTAVGFHAMTAMSNGATSSNSLYNTTCLGAKSAASGSNQVQLGDSETTVYCYGSVQDRSDARDKADVRDTVLGLDFIKRLRPVDFRWDYRDSYIDIADDGSISMHEKDGSRKRTRYHHGLIAQEVKTVLDENGIDFGGYQDHKINGGNDVLTLGYEEFIAPIIKAIQELDVRIENLEA